MPCCIFPNTVKRLTKVLELFIASSSHLEYYFHFFLANKVMFET